MSSPILDQAPYTIDNLPYGVISTSSEPVPRCAVAIGHHAIDLAKYSQTGRLSSISSTIDLPFDQIFSQPALNTFAALPWPTRRAVRAQLQSDLRSSSIPSSCLTLLSETNPHLPMKIGGFSDYYTSLDHCKNCSGELTAKHIYKNWYFAPSVYNSRVSSLLPSPCAFHRPTNISFSGALDSDPIHTPSRKLDFELEMGYFVSQPVPFGETLPISSVQEHIFGFVLLNDWSARDHQLFEMRPLGPFHSKGFATGISNWVVPMEALAPRFACAPTIVQDPPPFEHLTWGGGKEREEGKEEREGGALDVRLRVKVVREGRETVLATSNLRYLYWTPYQQLVHHASSGCGMETGDLVGTGTISGSGRDEEAGGMAELGCLYEAERTGTERMPREGVSGRYQRGYLEDGDEVVLEGWCENGEGRVVLGFGECRGKVLPPK